MEFTENQNRNQINVAILGAVSAGKSTLLNTIFNECYSDCKIKRTTMTPQVYYENTKKVNKEINKSVIIKNKNKEINDNLIQKSENEETITINDIQEINHFVDRIYNFTELKKDIFLTVYDIPGLNDCRTKDVFFKYLENNFNKFDIIIFVIDIESALNTDGEVDILTKILEYSKINKDKYKIENKLIVLGNKCDELFLDTNDNLVLEGEHKEMFDQILKQIKQKQEKIYPDLEYEVTPISLEDSFIYRMYEKDKNCKLDMKYINKFGRIEYGKKWNRLTEEERKVQIKKLVLDADIKESLKITGYNNFTDILNKFLKPENQKIFINNHIIQDIQNIKNNTKVNIEDDLQLFYNYYQKYLSLEKRIKKGISTLSIFEEYFTDYLNEWYNNIILTFIESRNVQNIDTYYLKQDNFITQIEEAKNILNNSLKLFNGDIQYLCDIYKHINEALNNYYIDKINNKNNPLNSLFEYLEKLVVNKFQITKDIISNLFSNPDILNKTPDEIINYLDDIEQQGHISKEDKKEKLLDILEMIYDELFYNNIINYQQDKFTINYIKDNEIPSYIYFVSRFWEILIISYEHSNLFDEKIYNLDFKIKKLYHKFYQRIASCSSHPSKYQHNLINNKNKFLKLEKYYLSMFLNDKIVNKYKDVNKDSTINNLENNLNNELLENFEEINHKDSDNEDSECEMLELINSKLN